MNGARPRRSNNIAAWNNLSLSVLKVPVYLYIELLLDELKVKSAHNFFTKGGVMEPTGHVVSNGQSCK